jgi:hypothetical protein
MTRPIRLSLLLVLSSTAALGATPYPVVVATHGVFFMGGNRISAPYRLTFTDDHRLTVNEFRFPPMGRRVPPGWVPTAADTADDKLVRSALTLRDSLYLAGVTEQAVQSRVYAFLRSSTLVDSVELGERSVGVRFLGRSGFLWIPTARLRPGKTLPASFTDSLRAAGPTRDLEMYSHLLDNGAVIFMLNPSNQCSFGSFDSAEVLDAVSRVLRRQPLSLQQEQLLESSLQDQLRSPIVLERVP